MYQDVRITISVFGESDCYELCSGGRKSYRGGGWRGDRKPIALHCYWMKGKGYSPSRYCNGQFCPLLYAAALVVCCFWMNGNKNCTKKHCNDQLCPLIVAAAVIEFYVETEKWWAFYKGSKLLHLKDRVWGRVWGRVVVKYWKHYLLCGTLRGCRRLSTSCFALSRRLTEVGNEGQMCNVFPYRNLLCATFCSNVLLASSKSRCDGCFFMSCSRKTRRLCIFAPWITPLTQLLATVLTIIRPCEFKRQVSAPDWRARGNNWTGSPDVHSSAFLWTSWEQVGSTRCKTCGRFADHMRGECCELFCENGLQQAQAWHCCVRIWRAKFYGMVIEQHDDYSVTIQADDKFIALECVPLSCLRRRHLESPLIKT